MTGANQALSPPRKLSEILSDRLNTNANRAAECLLALDALSADDLARPDFRAAAQTFALLAISDALIGEATGRNLADATLMAAGLS